MKESGESLLEITAYSQGLVLLLNPVLQKLYISSSIYSELLETNKAESLTSRNSGIINKVLSCYDRGELRVLRKHKGKE